MKRVMMNVLGIAVVAYLGLVILMWVSQRKLMYFPGPPPPPPAELGLEGFSEVAFTASDGTKLIAWSREAKPGWPTILYFHGNAGTLFDRTSIYRHCAEAGFGVIALEYRGYGASEGHPHEAGFYEDARATLAYARTLGLEANRLIYYGESLGTGVAIHLATEIAPGGIALQSPYTSVRGRAAEIYFFVPVRFLIQDKFDSIDKVAQLTSPVVIFHGEKDRIIPVRHGQALAEAIPTRVTFHRYPDIDHMDFDYALVAHELAEFARKEGLIDDAPAP